MQKNIWKSNYFKRVFKTVFIGSFLVLILAVTALYSSFHHASLSYSNTVNQNFMSNVASNMIYQMEQSQKNVLNAYTSSSGVTLIAQIPADVHTELTAMRAIDYFLSQDAFLHSAYFYNAVSNEIYMFGSDLLSCSLSSFPDSETVELIKNNSIQSVTLFPRTIPNSRYDSSQSQVITTFIPSGRGNMVVINLSIDKLAEVLNNSQFSSNDQRTGYLLFFDHSQLIYSTLPSLLSDLELNDLLSTIEKNNWSGTFSTSIHSVRHNLSALNLSDINFQLISVVPQRQAATSFLSFKVSFIIILALGALLALFINLWISRKLYSPIGTLLRTLPKQDTSLSDSFPITTQDELEYIRESIVQTFSRLENLFEYREKTLATNQATLVKRQLLYNQYTDEEFWNNCLQQELPYQPENQFGLIYAQWSNDNLSRSRPDDHRLVCYALSNIFHELADPFMVVQEVPFDRSGIAFLYSFNQQNPPTEQLSSCFSGIQQTFLEYFHLQVSFFVSPCIPCPSQLYPSMRNLQDLAHQQYFYDRGIVLFSNQYDSSCALTDLCPLPDMNQIELALRNSDCEQCRALLAGYFEQLPHYTVESACASVSMLASKLVALMNRIESSQPAFPAQDYHAFFQNIASAPSIFQAQLFINQQFQQIAAALSSTGSETNSLLADEVLLYLEEHYADYNLSSKSLALHHHISVAYLNRIFKQKTGETIASYLKKIRLKRAHELLLNTNQSVESIAKKVGFENTKYFYTLFKTEYGVSPSNYRISHSIMHSSNE